MISFPIRENDDHIRKPPCDDKPHINGNVISWKGRMGYRFGFAEDGHAFGVAEWLLEAMKEGRA